MQKVAIVTDSGTDLPDGFAAAHGVEVVPISLHIDGKNYLDGLDITKREFYRSLANGVRELHTSQPSPASFAAAFKRAAANGASILCVCLSSKLSGTYQAAVIGRELADLDASIEIVDSRSASVGTGLLVARAVKLAEQGKNLNEIVAEMMILRDRVKAFFVVDTLDYLKRNGRIGKAQALAGTLLKIKPILGLEDGLVVAKEKVRGQSKVMKRLVDIVVEETGADLGSNVFPAAYTAAIAHASAPEKAKELTKLLEEKVEFHDAWVAELGPTIGLHSGPGLVGIAFCPVEI